MEFSYSSACNKILNYYLNYLSEKDIKALKMIEKLENYNDPETIKFIKQLIEQIWEQTLTKKENYEEGKPFSFLITKDKIPSYALNPSFPEFYSNKPHTIELLTDKNINNYYPESSGFIIKIDFKRDNTPPILPIDFEEGKKIIITSSLQVDASCCFYFNISDYDINACDVSDYSNYFELEKINIHRPLYNYLLKNKILYKEDQDYLAKTIITYFLDVKYNKVEQVALKNLLAEKYKTVISEKYIEYFHNIITLDDFINFVSNLLENEPTMPPQQI